MQRHYPIWRRILSEPCTEPQKVLRFPNPPIRGSLWGFGEGNGKSGARKLPSVKCVV